MKNDPGAEVATPKARVRRQDDPQLFIARLPSDMGDDQLLAIFADFRAVRARVVRDRETGESRGFGFVWFFDAAETARALQEMDGEMVGGRRIVVTAPRPREASNGEAQR